MFLLHDKVPFRAVLRPGLTALAALLLACTHSVDEPAGGKQVVTFDPVMYAATKSAVPGQYPPETPFGVSAWDYAAGNKWDEDGKAGVFLSDAKVACAEGVWAPVPEVLWPSGSRRLAFIAYSPYGKAVSVTPDDGVSFADVDTGKDQTDLLFTAPVADQSRYSGAGIVDLPFRHALCLVDFQLRCNASESESATLREVALSEIYLKGDFRSLPGPQWSGKGQKQEVVFFEGERELPLTNTPVGNSLWLIPQTVMAKIRVRIRYRDPLGNETFEILESSPLGIPLDSGRHYTFTLACALESMTLKVDLLDNLL